LSLAIERLMLVGRQLGSLQNGISVINYTYNADGVRIGKSGSRAGTFIVSGTQILREINSVATIDYLYDENGSPIGLTYKGKHIISVSCRKRKTSSCSGTSL